MKAHEAMKDRCWGLQCRARRSLRYHDRRSKFFENCHRGALLVGLFGYSAILSNMIAPSLHKWLAVAVAITFAFDIVVGFSRKAWLHADLKQRFLEMEELLVGPQNDEQLDGVERMILKIERGEPPVMRALDVLCHNELAQAEGIDDQYRVRWYQRVTAHFYAWGAASWERAPSAHMSVLDKSDRPRATDHVA